MADSEPSDPHKFLHGGVAAFSAAVILQFLGMEPARAREPINARTLNMFAGCLVLGLFFYVRAEWGFKDRTKLRRYFNALPLGAFCGAASQLIASLSSTAAWIVMVIGAVCVSSFAWEIILLDREGRREEEAMRRKVENLREEVDRDRHPSTPADPYPQGR